MIRIVLPALLALMFVEPVMAQSIEQGANVALKVEIQQGRKSERDAER